MSQKKHISETKRIVRAAAYGLEKEMATHVSNALGKTYWDGFTEGILAGARYAVDHCKKLTKEILSSNFTFSDLENFVKNPSRLAYTARTRKAMLRVIEEILAER